MIHTQLDQQMGRLIQNERANIYEMLLVINRVSEMKSYLILGYPSLFEWLTRRHGYAGASAYRRIEAARLLQVVPEMEAKIKTGELNLSNMCKTHSLLKTQERKSGKRISREQKKQIVQKIENKSIEQTERILIAEFPELAKSVHKDQRSVVNETITRCAINLDEDAIKDLNRARDILGHRLPYGTDADVIAYALKFLLKKLDVLRFESKKNEPKENKSEQNDSKNTLSDNHTAYSLSQRKRSAS